MTGETLLWLTIALPAAGTLAIWATGRVPNLREAVTLATAVALCVLVGLLAEQVLGGARPSLKLVETLPAAPVYLAVEPLGMMFALIASFLWIVNSIYSIGYMRGNGEKHQTRFYVCFAIAISSTMGIAFAGNLFTLFLFYEILTLSTYPLVTHKANEEAIAGRLGHISVLLLGTSMVPAADRRSSWTWVEVGALDLQADGGILRARSPTGSCALLLLFLHAYGIGKAALMPIHPWLPAAMVAPTPVSALACTRSRSSRRACLLDRQDRSSMSSASRLPVADPAPGPGGCCMSRAAPILIASVVAHEGGQPQTPAGLFHRQPAVICDAWRRRCLAPISVVMGAALHIAAHAVEQDYPVLRRRLDLHRRPPDRGQPAQRHRPARCPGPWRRSPVGAV